MKLLFALVIASVVSAVVVKVDLSIAMGKKVIHPDLGEQEVILINGQFPGPEIRAKQGDMLDITIHNTMTMHTGIHYHGLNQYGTPFYDGTPGVSQCPMEPDSKVHHKFQLTEAGTYWYHPHQGIQRIIGGYGSIIVEEANKEEFIYDEEETIILADWWNMTYPAIESGLTQAGGFGWPGNGFTVLINGRPNYSLEVQKGKTYRLRLISAAALHYLTFQIHGHTLEVVEADGSAVQPVSLKQIGLSPGQRYSVLLRSDQDAAEYPIYSNDQFRGPDSYPEDSSAGHLPALEATLTYQGSLAQNTDSQPHTVVDDQVPGWEIKTLFGKTSVDLPSPTKEFVFKVTQEWLDTDGTTDQGKTETSSLKWLWNGKALIEPKTPYVLQSALGVADDTPAISQQKIPIKIGDVVDAVFLNGVAGNGLCEQHPIHLHGHKFWVIAQGSGSYSADSADLVENFVNPVYRDSVTMFPSDHYHLRNRTYTKGTPKSDCGWVKVRFVADNAGPWLFHCHTAQHNLMGMAAVFDETGEKKISLPEGTHLCGQAATTDHPDCVKYTAWCKSGNDWMEQNCKNTCKEQKPVDNCVKWKQYCNTGNKWMEENCIGTCASVAASTTTSTADTPAMTCQSAQEFIQNECIANDEKGN